MRVRAALVAVMLGGGQVLLAGPAGAVTAAKAELKGGQLRVEGTAAPNVFVIVESTTGAAGARADLKGLYKVQAANFTAPDCRLTISDGRTPTATVAIAGCSPTATPVPPTPAPPTGGCVINTVPPVTLSVGGNAAVNFQTTGCNTTFNSGATPTPVQWRIAAGAIPTGMTGPNFQGLTGGNIIGVPSVPGTYQFTLAVTDQVSATDQENVTITVA